MLKTNKTKKTKKKQKKSSRPRTIESNKLCLLSVCVCEREAHLQQDLFDFELELTQKVGKRCKQHKKHKLEEVMILPWLQFFSMVFINKIEVQSEILQKS